MVLKPTSPVTNGNASRKCKSWIESFTEWSGGFLETNETFRRWTAISALGAILERKVWVSTGSDLFPNLFVFLVGPAAIGKTRAIIAMQDILREVPDFHFSPNVMTKASMIDCLFEATRTFPNWEKGPGGMGSYHTMYVAVDELSMFMAKWDEEIVGALTSFFDGHYFLEAKRTANLRREIERPNLNVLCGATPDMLMKVIPEVAWGQGFTSRVILVYGDNSNMKDIFDVPELEAGRRDLVHDIKLINRTAFGQFTPSPTFQSAFHEWRESSCNPRPSHPKLKDYVGRRHTHVLKLAMIAAVDRGGHDILELEDFDRAKSWLLSCETNIERIFEAGSATIDFKAMEEIAAYVGSQEKAIPHHKLLRYAAKFIPVQNLERVVNLMLAQKLIKVSGVDEKSKQITYLGTDD